jgi:hypothetical protein
MAFSAAFDAIIPMLARWGFVFRCGETFFSCVWPFEVQRYCIQSTKPLHRRTTETGMTIGVRMLQDPLAVIDAWIAKQNAPELSRLEAIRHLVDLGLTARK